MNSLIVLVLGAVTIAVGYGYYARYIDRTVIQPDEKKATPARMYMDGVDFTPANRSVLFGYQFKSIAALGPIVGPIVAVQWGWLPALLWILLGVFFIGWVQDYGSMMMSTRREGDTMGALSYKLISPRARSILLIFIYIYLLMIMGAFGIQVGFGLLVNPNVPFGMLAVVLMGILAGQMTYKWKQDIILTTVVTVIVALVGIWVGTLPAVSGFFATIYGTAGGAKSPVLFLDVTMAKFIGSLLVVVFCYFGAVLPIWGWAQPINYVSFWIVALGVLGGLIGLLLWRPGMGDFPAFTQWSIGIGPLWPILFVTIACGAISGWHSLVSTSGTARQLERETDALPVGAGAMFLEMGFAVVAFLAATVAFGSFQAYGDTLKSVAALGVFAQGLAAFLERIGIPRDFGVAYGSVFLTIMALTILHLVVRFMRVASAEFLGDKVPAMKNVHVGSIVALALTLLLIWIMPWLTIWVVFGAANQLMAGLALLLVALWLMSEGKRSGWAFWPAIFMLVTTIFALLFTAWINLGKIATAKTATEVIAFAVISLIAVVLVVAALFLVYDGWRAIQKYRAAVKA